jgi:uncharacterized protein YbcI
MVTVDSDNLSRDVSRAMVKLLKDHIGRGPSYARAHIHDDLADEGEEDLVRNIRQALNGTFRQQASEIVEQLTGRKVSSFLSDHDVERDIVVQAFVLVPQPDSAAGA